jgi:hypothetical protein
MVILREPFPISGRAASTGKNGPVRRILFYVNPFVFAFCLACIYLGMREVLRLGGFVASGGPYVIAHEAPGWIWLFPACIFLMVMSILLAAFTGFVSGKPNIMALSWSALFTSLGWNFLEFGLGIGMKGDIAWGWVACAALFIPMGVIPLVYIVWLLVGDFKVRRRRPLADDAFDRERASGANGLPVLTVAAQLVSAAAGFMLGTFFFRSLA